MAATVIVLLFASCLRCYSIEQAHRNDTIEEQLYQAAAKSWAEYGDLVRSLQGKYSLEVKVIDLAPKQRLVTSSRTTYLLRASGEATSLEAIRERSEDGAIFTQGPREVFAINPEYSFALLRKSAATDSPWVVTHMSGGTNSDTPFPREEYVRAFNNSRLAMIRLRGRPLSDFIDKGQFGQVRCRPLPQDGDALVEVTFNSPVNRQQLPGDVESGSMVLDRNRYWTLHSAEVKHSTQANRGITKVEVIDVASIRDNAPIPKRIDSVMDFVWDDGRKRRTEVSERWELAVPTRQPSDRDFTLEAYGLPAPKGMLWPRKSIPPFAWAAGAAILCLALALLLRRGIWLNRKQDK
jgi:hypothetical protein